MKNKILSALLCGLVTVSLLAAPVSATTFSDVENDETVSWAKDAINDMTDLGYIKGYEDGTFKPQQAVSKIETLLLMSRIMGVEESTYSETLDWAYDEYGATVSAINTQYVDELCFLMYYDVIDLSDLRTYASEANANTSLMRWQAAYLMVKLAGMEDEALETELDKNKYSDYDEIPESARSYIAYAEELGLMNGMGDDGNGGSYFSPTGTLTRAQMATLLDRMITKMDRYSVLGTVDYISSSEITVVDGKTEYDFDIEDATLIKINGADGSTDDVTVDSDAMITVTFDKARLIEVVPAETKTVVYGVVVQTSDNANGTQITIKDYENQSDTATYTFGSGCKYTIKGTTGSFGDLKAGNCVRLTLTGSSVSLCEVIDKSISETATFVEITSEDDATYLIATDEDGYEIQYVISTNGADVTRNKVDSSLRDLVEGDEVTLTLTYGKVTDIIATSDTEDAVGTIVEIILSASPEITLEINGKEKTYSMTTSTAVTVNNVDATIYDLRPGAAASVVIDGTSISSISANSTGSTGKTSVTGEVTSINTTLKVITLTNSSGGTETVYYDSTTTFLKSTGSTTNAKSLVAGNNITATGSDSTGYFVATIIISD